MSSSFYIPGSSSSTGTSEARSPANLDVHSTSATGFQPSSPRPDTMNMRSRRQKSFTTIEPFEEAPNTVRMVDSSNGLLSPNPGAFSAPPRPLGSPAMSKKDQGMLSPMLGMAGTKSHITASPRFGMNDWDVTEEDRKKWFMLVLCLVLVLLFFCVDPSFLPWTRWTFGPVRHPSWPSLPHLHFYPQHYFCPDPSGPRTTTTLLDRSTLSPLTTISTLSPNFNVTLSYSLAACNSFRVIITRADTRVCQPLSPDDDEVIGADPSKDPEVLSYVKRVLGPDSFQLRVDGAERLVMDTPTMFDPATCSYIFDWRLNAAGTVWLDIVHLYEKYNGFNEKPMNSIERVMFKFFDTPLQLNICSSKCPLPIAPPVGKPAFIFPPPDHPKSLLPACTGPDPIAGTYVPHSLPSLLYPPYELPVTKSRPTAGFYRFVPEGCEYRHDGMRFGDPESCFKKLHRALLIGDSHARAIFDVAKNRFEGIKTMTLSSYKTASKFVDFENLHLEFLWDPFMIANFQCQYMKHFDSITVSTGAHQGCYKCPTSQEYLSSLEEIFSSWPKKVAECGRKADTKPNFIFLNTPAWQPQKSEHLDCRTGQRLEYWNAQATLLARKHGWAVVDVFGLTRPFAVDSSLIDGVHYLKTDAIDPIADEWIEKIGVCGSS